MMADGRRHARSLSGDDIGAALTIRTDEFVATGVLASVHHGIEGGWEASLQSAEPSRKVLGRQWVRVELGPFTGDISPAALVSSARPRVSP